MATTQSLRRPLLRLGLALLLILSLCSLALNVQPVAATNHTVTNTDDSGAGSLRQAIEDANNGDTIEFNLPGASPWTITLTSGALNINKSVTINGPMVGTLTLLGSGLPFSVVVVRSTDQINGDPLTAALSYLTVRGGSNEDTCGGGISNDGTLTLDHVTVSGNTAYTGAGICNTYHLTLNNSTVSGNTATNTDGAFSYGGGIYNYGCTFCNDPNIGIVTVTNSTISNNTALGGGGGIYSELGTVTVTNGTISGNNANHTFGVGGGIDNTGRSTLIVQGSTISDNEAGDDGGGIANQVLGNWGDPATVTATISNSTISGNRAGFDGGGLYNESDEANTATLHVSFSTITGNTADSNLNGGGDGGGIALQPTNAQAPDGVNILSSIVVGNTDGTNSPGTQKHNCLGSLTSQGHNVFGSGADCPSGGTDLSFGGAISALLNTTLADNGGPTLTHALVNGSLAINAGDDTACAAEPISNLDQRGIVRPQGDSCDSGAYELVGGVTPTVTLTLTYTGGGTGTVARNPQGTETSATTFDYIAGTPIELTPKPDNGSLFIGWALDTAASPLTLPDGWADPATLTMDTDHSLVAVFAPTKAFVNDVPINHQYYTAITALATRGYILGYNANSYGPADGVQRAQMAALISRGTPEGPGIPTKGYVAPPDCVIVDTWDCEDWGNTFTDQGGIVASLWRNAGTLQHYQVAFGYTANDCAARGRAFPCYGPTDPVSHAQTIAFITRAMIVKGYWVAQPNAVLPDPGVPGVLATEAKTFAYYTGGLPALPNGKGWNDGATRGWFAQALWQALNSYWGIDGPLTDGRDAGGFLP